MVSSWSYVQKTTTQIKPMQGKTAGLQQNNIAYIYELDDGKTI